jgi:hypothetical protein
MSQYVADRAEYEELQSLTDAGDGVQAVLNRYIEGEEIAESESYAEYLTAVSVNRQPRTVDCAGCTDATATTTSESWIWGTLEAIGVGAVLGLAAVLAEEIDIGEIVGMLL